MRTIYIYCILWSKVASPVRTDGLRVKMTQKITNILTAKASFAHARTVINNLNGTTSIENYTHKSSHFVFHCNLK